jgi:hypothetical protein
MTKTPAARSPELEHAHESTRHEAEQLLTSAGSADHAQRAIESAVGQSSAASQGDKFARRWKFGSYLEMFEASKPLATIESKHWLATSTGDKKWIVWNEQDLAAAYTVASLEEAKQLLAAAGQADAQNVPPTG